MAVATDNTVKEQTEHTAGNHLSCSDCQHHDPDGEGHTIAVFQDKGHNERIEYNRRKNGQIPAVVSQHICEKSCQQCSEAAKDHIR